MKQIVFNSALTLTVYLLGLGITEATNAFTIDNFNTGSSGVGTLNNPSPFNNVTSTSSLLSESDVVGTARDVQVLVSNPGTFNTFGSAVVNDNITAPINSFVAARSNGPSNVLYSIVWDGASLPTNPLTVNTSGLGSRNLAIGGNNAIRFDVVSFDNITTTSSASVTVWSNGGLVNAVNTINNLSTFSIGSDLFFSFTGFTGGTVDFTQVSAIRFDLNLPVSAGASSNFGIDVVEAVPIPFEFNPAIGVGILGLVYGATKFKKARKVTN